MNIISEVFWPEQISWVRSAFVIIGVSDIVNSSVAVLETPQSLVTSNVMV